MNGRNKDKNEQKKSSAIQPKDLTYTSGIDTFINVGAKTNTLAVSPDIRNRFLSEHSYSASLLKREEANPLLEEGVWSAQQRGREGEYYLTHEALTLLIECDLKRHRHDQYDTRNIYVVKNDEQKLNYVLRGIEINADDAKLVNISGIHAVPFYLRRHAGKMHCLIVDSEATKYDPPEAVMNAVRNVFPDVQIVLMKALLQKDYFSCTTFAYHALRYFCKHGKDVFPYIDKQINLQPVEGEVPVFFLPAHLVMPALLKMCQSPLQLSDEVLDKVVSRKANLTLRQYWQQHQYMLPDNKRINTSAIEKKYKYINKIEGFIDSHIKDSGVSISQNGNIPLPVMFERMHERYSQTRKQQQANDIPLFSAWSDAAVKLLARDPKEENNQMAALQSIDLQTLMNDKNIPAKEFNELEYQKLAPFILAAICDQQKTLNQSEQVQNAAEYAAQLICLFGDMAKAVEYLKRFYAKTRGVSTQLVHDACLFSLPATKKWSVSLWRELLQRFKPSSSEDLIMRIFSLADRMEKHANIIDKPLAENTSFSTLQDHLKHLVYARSDENPEAAFLLFEHGISEDHFNLYLSLQPKDDNEQIPDILIKGEVIAPQYKGYYLKKLNPSDPRAAILGKLTSCCQSLGGIGHACAVHGITSSYGGFYVLCKMKNSEPEQNDKILAQCWAWRSQEQKNTNQSSKDMMFDSVESQVDFRRNYENMLVDFYVYLAHVLVTKHAIPRVLVGKGNTPNHFDTISPLTKVRPIDYNDYRDSRAFQRIVADHELPIIQFYIAMHAQSNLRFNSGLISEFHVDNMDALKRWCDYCAALDKPELALFILPYVRIHGVTAETILTRIKLVKAWFDMFTDTDKPIDIAKVKECIDDGMSVNSINVHGDVMLHSAIHDGNLTLVKLLVEQGADLNALNKDGNTALHIAIEEGETAIVDYLLTLDCDLSVRNESGYQAIGLAAKKSNWPLFDKLFAKLASAPGGLRMDYDPLIWEATEKNRSGIIDLILQSKPDINHEDIKGNTLLHTLIKLDVSIEKIKSLLAAGAIINSRNHNNITPLHMAAEKGNLELVQLLHQSGADLSLASNYGFTALHFAAHKKQWHVVHWLIETTKMDPNLIDNKNRTPALFAAKFNEPKELLWLLLRGAKLNGESQKVILSAAEYNEWESVETLMLHGISPLLQNENGNSVLHFAARKGNKSIFKLAHKLMKHTDFLNQKNKDGGTPILEAASYQQWDLVNWMLRHKADMSVVDNNGQSVLSHAAQSCPIDKIKRYIKHGARVNDVSGKRYAPLTVAAKKENWPMVECLLEHGADINSGGDTVLHRAAYELNLDRVKWLISRGAKLNAEDDNGVTPLGAIFSSRYGYDETLHDKMWEMAAYLIKNIPDINLDTKTEHLTLLIEAIGRPRLDMVKLLISKGADVNACNSNGEHPLQFAIRMASWEPGWVRNDSSIQWDCAIELINCSASNLHVVNQAGDNLLHYIAASNRTDVAEMLYQKGLRIETCNHNGWPAFFTAISEQRSIMTEWMLAHADNVAVAAKDGVTAIHLAAQTGKLALIELLIRRGVDVSAKDNQQRSAVHYAAVNKQWDIVRWLLAHDIRFDVKAKECMDVLCKAAEEGQLDIVKSLHAKGASFYGKNENNKTCVDLAGKNKHWDVIEWILSNDANPNAAKNYAGDLIYMAAAYGQFGLVKELAAHGALIDTKGDMENTPLHAAMAGGHWDIVKWLLDRGANIHAKNHWDSSVLHRLASAGQLELLKKIVTSGMDINKKNKSGETALYDAIYRRQWETAEWMIENGAVFHVKNDKTKVMFLESAYYGQLKLVQWFVKNGVSVDCISPFYADPAIYEAAEKKHWHVVKWLAEQGANVNLPRKYEYKTPLLSAVARADALDALEALIRAGIDINQQEKNYDKYYSAINTAARNEKASVVECLLRHGATLNKEDAYFVVCCAAKENNFTILKMLEQRGVNIDETNGSAMMSAMRQEHWDFVRYLFKHGIKFDDSYMPCVTNIAEKHQWDIVRKIVRQESGFRSLMISNTESILHLACRSKEWKTARCLARHCAQIVKCVDAAGQTALHLAAQHGDLRTVKRLLKAGVDANVKDKMGKTALDLAKHCHHRKSRHRIKELLLKYITPQVARSDAGTLFAASKKGSSTNVQTTVAIKPAI